MVERAKWAWCLVFWISIGRVCETDTARFIYLCSLFDFILLKNPRNSPTSPSLTSTHASCGFKFITSRERFYIYFLILFNIMNLEVTLYNSNKSYVRMSVLTLVYDYLVLLKELNGRKVLFFPLFFIWTAFSIRSRWRWPGGLAVFFSNGSSHFN